jgi:hypothetical protein
VHLHTQNAQNKTFENQDQNEKILDFLFHSQSRLSIEALKNGEKRGDEKSHTLAPLKGAIFLKQIVWLIKNVIKLVDWSW